MQLAGSGKTFQVMEKLKLKRLYWAYSSPYKYQYSLKILTVVIPVKIRVKGIAITMQY